jgi:Dyp-type peroxidase family
MENESTELEKDEIQGLVFTGYPKNTAGAYLLLRVVDAARARAWLASRIPSLTFGELRQYGATSNIAFSAPGLAALGLDAASLGSFPLEFREGLRERDDGFRPRILGDVGDSAPSRWLWGGPARPEVHLVLMLYGSDASLPAQLAAERSRFEGALQELYHRSTISLPDRREHFGFADGISQSRFEGQSAPGSTPEVIRAGEFLLGYRNEFGHVPTSPVAGAQRVDLGRNGTFLVMRQLEQDVQGFWGNMLQHAQAGGESSAAPAGEKERERATWLAAKCVGRWPSGAPLVSSPDHDDPSLGSDNGFDYGADPDGLRCPIGSHIRKANPRDSLEPNAESSWKATRRRRILRRGRAYGPPLAPFASEPARQERGLMFIGLNTNIRRQFEFIQQSWLNNEKFDGMYEDQDPVVGDQTPDVGSTFTIPARPLRLRLTGLPRFVQVRGGEYFFLPGRSALVFLSELAGAERPASVVRNLHAVSV